MRYLLVTLVLLGGCGGGSGAGDDDSDSDGGGSTDGGGATDASSDGGDDACGRVACSATTCGTATDACGQPIVCDRCRFSADLVAEVFTESVAVVAGDPIVVGYDDFVATRGAGGSVATLPAGNIVDLAVANGTTWALLDSGGGDLSLAFSSGGSWTVESIFDTREPGRMAVASDGTVHVAYGGGGSASGVVSGLVLARRTAAGQWTYRSVSPAQTNVPEYVDVALVGGEPWILWNDRNQGSLKLSMASGGAFMTETVDADLPIIAEHDLSLAIDGQGRAHVAYRQNSPMFREIEYAMRDGGAWTHESVAVLRNGAEGPVRVAVSAAGVVAVAYLDSQGAALATRESGRWFVQPLDHDANAVDLAFDAAGTMHAVLSSWPSQIRLFTHAGTYPSGYDATCDQVAATLCPLACGCGANCCIGSPTGTHACQSPIGFCQYVVDWMICGDASQDPQVASDCQSAASSSTCASGELQTPAACML